MSTRSFSWAARTLLEFCNIPATPNFMSAIMVDSKKNQQWIYALIKTACPQPGSMTSTVYNQCIEILQANGVQVNPYGPGSG